ncbi:hypothetical protein AWM75_07955 [Aerococcus urinaehominis]|uniref:Carbohydrate kinase PfkB domain-containing protein n=1 Tax=Aerococcus urinaehominis TaxID=128944 RepID=A0A109RHI0_9LACT|nr:PfkB family carbohydrate kinase [Aerococcus urinaehominis]AMB99906.1 hypothetical protein AWM75_07955 [Aerococcus urinaehominis]SDM52304.1 pseudouridine kinase [Aerococcus urinaehominis]
MLTAREQEILNIIEHDPLISQEDLAGKLGISRSGVASHIHHLTRKGYIKGRGYVLSEPEFVSVIGSINMDILGTPSGDLIRNNSNPGAIQNSLGGAGRNIALNLTQLDVANYFISIYGNDMYGDEFEADAKRRAMNLDCCERTDQARTSSYMQVFDRKSNKYFAVDDMAINERMTPEFLSVYLDRINHSKLCVVDANLSVAALTYIFDQVTVPIIAKTVSLNKNAHILVNLSKLFALVATPKELKQIMVDLGQDQGTEAAAVSYLLGQGVKHILLFSEKTGLSYYSQDNQLHVSKGHQLVNVGGANAAITSVLVWGYLNQLGWKYIIQLAYCAAILTCAVTESVNPHLDLDRLFDTHDELFS